MSDFKTNSKLIGRNEEILLQRGIPGELHIICLEAFLESLEAFLNSLALAIPGQHIGAVSSFSREQGRKP